MRKSKRVSWEIMLHLEEAGEEDICSLLNQVMGAQPYFGSGADVLEYLDALTNLESHGELFVREYQIHDGRTVNLSIVSGMISRPPTAFSFDANARIWKWQLDTRQMVELPKG